MYYIYIFFLNLEISFQNGPEHETTSLNRKSVTSWIFSFELTWPFILFSRFLLRIFYNICIVFVFFSASSCDMVFHSDSTKTGIVTSPGYPNPYPPRATCRYDFQGRGKERVQIIFQDFNLFHPSGDTKE